MGVVCGTIGQRLYWLVPRIGSMLVCPWCPPCYGECFEAASQDSIHFHVLARCLLDEVAVIL